MTTRNSNKLITCKRVLLRMVLSTQLCTSAIGKSKTNRSLVGGYWVGYQDIHTRKYKWRYNKSQEFHRLTLPDTAHAPYFEAYPHN